MVKVFGLVCLMLNVPVNNFSVMLGRSHRFLGITSTFGGKYVLLKDTTRRPEWGSNPRSLNPESEVLTTRPPRPPANGQSHNRIEQVLYVKLIWIYMMRGQSFNSDSSKLYKAVVKMRRKVIVKSSSIITPEGQNILSLIKVKTIMYLLWNGIGM